MARLDQEYPVETGFFVWVIAGYITPQSFLNNFLTTLWYCSQGGREYNPVSAMRTR